MLLNLFIAFAVAQVPAGESVFVEYQGKKNHCLQFVHGAKKAIIISPGMSEPAKKYRSLIKDLDLKEYDVYVWDHRGQGDSDYEDGVKDPLKVYVKDYRSYIDPLVAFLKTIKPKYDSLSLISHSMGAHVALRINMEEPELFDKVVYSAPMVEIMLKGAPRWLAQLLMPLIWSKMDWCPGAGAYHEPNAETSNVSSSKRLIKDRRFSTNC